ncbi:MAG: DNA-3-methyladenine glycosylase I [Myxococcota bacterium]|jgi:DNA-3-methyladenine glycosylase I|nr:DNA-3-methyladenine glycosylase I [Myxococcota bacterium]
MGNAKTRQEQGLVRCGWAGPDPIYVQYHDEEWGAPVHDDRVLLEFLVLEGAQAGLSWLTILKRRQGYRRAFADFDPLAIARMTEADVARLMQDTAIIRNRRKIEAAIRNAGVFLDICEEFGSFAAYQWRFVDGKPILNHWKTLQELPAHTPLSDTMSKDLKKRGMGFVGSTIIYSHMQAVGMVNDHLTSCFRHEQVARLSMAETR